MGANEHPKKRCDTCEFWAPGDQRSYNPKRDPDDREGACHRNAPPATHGGFEYEVLKLLSIIAWERADEEQQQKDFNDWEEAPLGLSSWPATTGGEWCGEWELRTSETKGLNYPPNEVGDAPEHDRDR